MTNFSNTLVIDNQQYSFSFSEIKRIDSSKYYVSVKGSSQLELAFEMKRGVYNDNWVVCQPAPEWILNKQATFSNWINHNKAHHERFVVG